MGHAVQGSKASLVYGWSAEGKTPAEIEADIRQTRYRLNADVQELKDKLQPKRLARRAIKAKWPVAAAALAGILIRLLIRRARR